MISEEFVSHGKDGDKGDKGNDGSSVTVVTEQGSQDDTQGTFVRVYSLNPDGTLGDIVSESFIANGDNGESGKDGKDGINGTSSTIIAEPGVNDSGDAGVWIRTYFVNDDGTPGDMISEAFMSNAIDGVDGTNGTHGIDGTDGTNGTDGINGTHGIDGRTPQSPQIPQRNTPQAPQIPHNVVKPEPSQNQPSRQAPQRFGQVPTYGKQGPMVDTGGHVQRDSLLVRLLSIFR